MVYWKFLLGEKIPLALISAPALIMLGFQRGRCLSLFSFVQGGANPLLFLTLCIITDVKKHPPLLNISRLASFISESERAGSFFCGAGRIALSWPRINKAVRRAGAVRKRAAKKIKGGGKIATTNLIEAT